LCLRFSIAALAAHALRNLLETLGTDDTVTAHSQNGGVNMSPRRYDRFVAPQSVSRDAAPQPSWLFQCKKKPIGPLDGNMKVAMHLIMG